MLKQFGRNFEGVSFLSKLREKCKNQVRLTEAGAEEAVTEAEDDQDDEELPEQGPAEEGAGHVRFVAIPVGSRSAADAAPKRLLDTSVPILRFDASTNAFAGKCVLFSFLSALLLYGDKLGAALVENSLAADMQQLPICARPSSIFICL